MRRVILIVLVLGLLTAGCGEGESIVEPGPGDPEESSTTSAPEDEDESTELVTEEDDEDVESTTSSSPPSTVEDSAQPTSSSTTVLFDETSENVAAYTELAASGLVLTLDEQSCADTAAEAGVAQGEEPVDALIAAVQECASPRAIDDFASTLIQAGGRQLPPTEAACVSSRLQSTEEYRPFWVALLDEEPFDFLLADLEVQNRYLDLYAECVSVGRAVSEQANVEFSPPTMGCIDDLYRDREFVRVTIEADLSGDPADRERIDGQIASCLSTQERAAFETS